MWTFAKKNDEFMLYFISNCKKHLCQTVELCYFVFEIATQPERIVNLFYILYQTATQIRQNGEPMLYCSSNCNKT